MIAREKTANLEAQESRGEDMNYRSEYLNYLEEFLSDILGEDIELVYCHCDDEDECEYECDECNDCCECELECDYDDEDEGIEEELEEDRDYEFLLPRKIIVNNPATVIYWYDGTKTVVKCDKEDDFDIEKGMAMATIKKLFGNTGAYNDYFRYCFEVADKL